MARDIDRYIRIQNPDGATTSRAQKATGWKTLPNCEKVGVWEYGTLTAPDEATGVSEKRFVFHIGFVDGVRKGSRVTYLGNHFSVLGVSDSTRLIGLELTCVASAG
jgi:hypothetical protein